MKNIIFLSIIGLLFSITVCGQESMKPDSGQESVKPDFRNVMWGMSKAQVKKTEKLEVRAEKDDLLGYNENVLGMSCWLIYYFDNDRLYKCIYGFNHKHSNRTDFIDDFNKLKKAITSKYGKPKSDKKYWKNDLYKDNPQKWGFAISLGHLIYGTIWENDRSKLFIDLSGENYKIQLRFVIESKVIKIEKKSTDEKF
jgi:hypothetical protein